MVHPSLTSLEEELVEEVQPKEETKQDDDTKDDKEQPKEETPATEGQEKPEEPKAEESQAKEEASEKKEGDQEDKETVKKEEGDEKKEEEGKEAEDKEPKEESKVEINIEEEVTEKKEGEVDLNEFFGVRNCLNVDLISENLEDISRTPDGMSCVYTSLDLRKLKLENLGNALLLFKHLRYIRMGNNKIPDISCIASLPRL